MAWRRGGHAPRRHPARRSRALYALLAFALCAAALQAWSARKAAAATLSGLREGFEAHGAAGVLESARCAPRRTQLAARNKNNAERAALYARLAGRLLSPEGRRLAPLASGQLSQGLDVADLFEVRRGEARGAAPPMDKDADKGSAQVGGSAA